MFDIFVQTIGWNAHIQQQAVIQILKPTQGAVVKYMRGKALFEAGQHCSSFLQTWAQAPAASVSHRSISKNERG